ncbi:DNA polymerase I [Bifidobacterium eulemuris]|uniref:DNA polymerase I n=1 Tax=Bifidobacterium eulemuris TaxID=1765219 RepID=A0A261GC78_9BIFI|nr:DNA polymerase I [Bifidobacterium eulemuris]OZG69038.1 DNA polymerase I [Bifidobacterium eulemuris]QOL31435.1 DNA polymerase I [Bifidobacterium eulemuris]
MSADLTIPDGEYRGTLLVVDGHSLAFRAFYGLPAENFTTDAGQPTNAVWGFATMLSQVVEAEKPDHLAVAFDVKGGTFRNDMLPQYKGTREAAPEELLSQLPLIQRMLTALGVTYIERPGYEGDDVIGTLATMGERSGYRTLVLSGDRDAFQLVDEHITVLYPGHHFKDLKRMTPEAVMEKYKVTPQQYPDLAALRGETADNIPGVPGVGDGFAAKWINQYGSLDEIVAHADEIGGKKGEALRGHLDQVLLNRKVNALVRDIDLGLTIDDLSFGSVDAAQVESLFKEMQFGIRTKNKVLRTFNGGISSSSVSAAPAAESDDGPKLPQGTRVSTTAEFDAWASARGIDATAPVDPDAAESVDIDRLGVPDLSARCDGALEDSWTLHVEGTAKPGDVTAETLLLMRGDQAAIIDLPCDGELRVHIQHLLDATHARTVVHGFKEQLHLLHAAGLTLDDPLLDTKLAGYLIVPDFHADTLEHAAARFLDFTVEQHEEATQGELDFGDDPSTDESHSDDRLLTHLALVRDLAATLAPRLDEREQYGLMEALEIPVSRVLQRMEELGATVDTARLTGMHEQFSAEANQAQEIAWDCAGTRVNLQSPKQLAKVLYEDLDLKPTKRTKSGSYTTNAAVLQELYVKSASEGDERASGFLGALLRHRETNKLKQIVATLIDATNRKDGRIHTTFEQTVAATGRLSSVDPNLQNIPNRNAAGREIRSAFVPGEGYESLMSCDYSQVELRIMAHLSGDEALIEAFRSGADFHKYVASLVYAVPMESITADQRSHVKAMSYGLAYGLSTYGLSQQLHIRPSEADVLKEKYFATFGKVHDYLESLVETARDKGYTETMFGRRRYFPALTALNRNAREAAERAALNAPIQGSAADIMKIAMIRADHALHEHNLASRVILQIHDELVVEIAPGESEQVSRLISDAMEHAVELSVPLDVSTGVGADWQLAAH